MIINDFFGGKFIFNGNLYSENNLDNLVFPGLHNVYDVVRVIGRVPLFLENHFNRLTASLQLSNTSDCLRMEQLCQDMNSLSVENKIDNFNVKIIVNKDNNKLNYIVYIVNSYYPTEVQYARGVKAALFCWERKNPNLKLINDSYKRAVKDELVRKEVFELLLTSKNNIITEGSKSNVFFIKGSKVYTSPGQFVLKGITRKYVLKACKNVNIELVEEPVAKDILSTIEGVFISSTSIKILPVAAIDNHTYGSSSNGLILAISGEFDKIVNTYIKNHIV